MLRICKAGHITGYRHCGTCRADTEPLRPFRIVDTTERNPVFRDVVFRLGQNHRRQQADQDEAERIRGMQLRRQWRKEARRRKAARAPLKGRAA